MKVGLSTYSLQQALDRKELSVPDAIRWIAEQGGQHVEIVPMGFNLIDNPELIEEIKTAAQEAGIELSNYAVGANFAVQESAEAVEQEIQSVMRHVDVAAALGVKLMRHDVAFRPTAEGTVAQFEADLPGLVKACQRIADYAAGFGITTSVENHGYYVQSSERIQRLLHETGRDNFKTTLDIGNFLCVDEDPVSAVKNNIPYASIVHAKDFYWRPSTRNPGEGWFQTSHGNYLRGAIVGHGDINMPEVFRVLKQSGYDGYISIEFEGMEHCQTASRIAMDNVRRLWDEA
ncbi:sugar phosphate isomerase/epimerase family protein [Paenibacillus silvae]|uniref:sugar phosphate isomerase/epimerase family protein n=1 Tax=Paenibacillus silvae TaxID=1325358 RepID=UPI0011A5F9F1|nr:MULTISPECIES: sugar phosphate isomerase/epimerase family protein [Paenibacillus]MCK6077710.1 sugar phosphate isomerase/epimerase [Paenibacillus silvae]MCK6151909.1 sugar phosphate isomerase/epimerase [Paenibacillus silvae]MCK6270594.1 sugar phosphate isomerase/epimerase [Paenibacillus silvae]